MYINYNDINYHRIKSKNKYYKKDLNNTHDYINNLHTIQSHIQKEKDKKTNKKTNTKQKKTQTNTQKRHI